MLDTLKEWQTLVSGLLAICAGGFVFHQTRAQAKAEVRKRLAKFEATRALLPLTLSELTGWTNKIIRILKTVQGTGVSNTLSHSERKIDLPSLPSTLVEQLRDLVEYNDDVLFRNYISSILKRIQVSRARLESLDPDKEPNLIILRSDIDNNLYDFLELGLWLESLFGFARGESTKCPEHPDWSRFGTQLSIHNVNGSENLLRRIRKVMDRASEQPTVQPRKRHIFHRVLPLFNLNGRQT